jgi:protein-S-isoprenylcysteine O-methyltransferase Ste14
MDSARQHLDDTAPPGVIARPIRLFPAALLLGLLADHLLPLPFQLPGTGLARLISAIGAGFLILIGIPLFAAGVKNFSRAATPLPTNEPARSLVTTGIHGWSRNPIYLGMFLIYIGFGLAAHSTWVLILLLPLALLVRYGVVAREEAYLARRFGDDYRAYAARVRRWL